MVLKDGAESVGLSRGGMSDFQSAWQAAHPTLDSVFSEPVRHEPQSDGPYAAGGPDPARPVVTKRGVFDSRSKPEKLRGKGRDEADHVDRVTTDQTIDFAISEFGDKANWPRVNDLLRLIGRPNAPAYSVVWVDDSEYGRVAFHVVEVPE